MSIRLALERMDSPSKDNKDITTSKWAELKWAVVRAVEVLTKAERPLICKVVSITLRT